MPPAIQRPLPLDALARLSSVAEVCDVLRGWGRPDLADRLAYFASDEDLDDGDVPLTLESALGFLAFFGAVESDEGEVDLGTSWDGLVLSVWRFPDFRRVSIWFQDRDTVRYAARKFDGLFADLNNGSEIGSCSLIMQNLVECKEWFTWFKDSPVVMNSRLHIT